MWAVRSSTQCCGLLTGPVEKPIFETPALSASLRPNFSGRKQAVEVINHKHVSISKVAIRRQGVSVKGTAGRMGYAPSFIRLRDLSNASKKSLFLNNFFSSD